MVPVDTMGARTDLSLVGHLARRLLNVELDNSSPLVMDWRAGIAIPIYLIMSMLAISSGVGGGLFWVPLFTALLQFDVKSAAALSQSCVAGGCIGGTLYSFMQRHPHDQERPVMDYNLALVLMPALVQGISFGVMLNYILPSLILSCLLIVTLLLISARTLHQGIKMVAAERRVRLEAQAREEELETRRSPMSPGYTDDETATFDEGSVRSRQSPVGVVAEPEGSVKDTAGCKIQPDVLAAKLSLAEEVPGLHQADQNYDEAHSSADVKAGRARARSDSEAAHPVVAVFVQLGNLCGVFGAPGGEKLLLQLLLGDMDHVLHPDCVHGFRQHVLYLVPGAPGAAETFSSPSRGRQ